MKKMVLVLEIEMGPLLPRHTALAPFSDFLSDYPLFGGVLKRLRASSDTLGNLKKS